MRNVLNMAQYAISAQLGNEIIRFNAREAKPIPEHLVNSLEFKRCSTLKDMGLYQEPNLTFEIKSQEPETVIVVDDKSTEAKEVIDVEPEPEIKPKRKRKKQDK